MGHKRTNWFMFLLKGDSIWYNLQNCKVKIWFKAITTTFTSKLIHHIFRIKLLLFDTKRIKHILQHCICNIMRFIYVKVNFQRQSHQETFCSLMSVFVYVNFCCQRFQGSKKCQLTQILWGSWNFCKRRN